MEEEIAMLDVFKFRNYFLYELQFSLVKQKCDTSQSASLCDSQLLRSYFPNEHMELSSWVLGANHLTGSSSN